MILSRTAPLFWQTAGPFPCFPGPDRVLDHLFAAGSLEEARNIIWEKLSRFIQ
ncbi:MAG: hypothetical protein HPY58_10145 [Firmicutes bacterium]|nr:hypothetical protein [Bacillota bacterium]